MHPPAPRAGVARTFFCVRGFDDIQPVKAKVQQWMGDRDFGSRDLFGVGLSLEEALVNSIKHGNRLDPEKIVRVDCQLSVDSIRLTVEDEGTGFDPDTLPDPTLRENLERPNGRGVFLIRALMTSVEYSNGGSRLTMSRHRETV